MSGPGNNNNSIPNADPGAACHDLQNSQIYVENELKTGDCNPIGLSDDSAANISLIVQITEQIPDESGTKCLQKSMAELNLPDSAVNGSTVNCVKDEDAKIIKTTLSHESNKIDTTIEESSLEVISDDDISPIITELSLNSKSLIENGTDFSEIKTNAMPVTEEESVKDHIPDSPVEETFLADQSETIAEDTPENMGSTKDIKSVSSPGSVNEFIENAECMVLESGELSVDTTFDENKVQDSPDNIVNPETIYNPDLGSTKDIKEPASSSESVNELPEIKELVLESDKLSKDQESPEKILNPETIYNQNIESTKDIKSVSSPGSVNEFIENAECMVLESGELSEDTTFDENKVQDSADNIVNPETIYNPDLGSTKDIKESACSSESVNELPEIKELVLENGKLSKDQDSPARIVNPETIYNPNLGSTKDISSAASVNEMLQNNQYKEFLSRDSGDSTIGMKHNQYSNITITINNRNMGNNKKINKPIGPSETVKKLIENREMVLESGELSEDLYSPAKIVKPETIYNQSMESTKDIKESHSSAVSVNKLLQNKQCKECVSRDSGDSTIDVNRVLYSNITITINNPNVGNNKNINKPIGASETVKKLIQDKEMVLESGELSQDTTVDVGQVPVKASEESADLEDGEVSDADDSVAVKVPVCRFYIRNGCSWGSNCRFRHPGSKNKGNYVMFENKVLPVVSTPLFPAWIPPMPPAYPFNLNVSVNVDRSYIQDPTEGPKRAPLLPTPSFNDILLAQKNYTKLDDLKRPVRSLPQPVVWSSRPRISSPRSTAIQWSPGRNRSPSVSPPRRTHRETLEVRLSTDAATLTSKPSNKRCRLPSPLPSAATRVRGPRTPPSSPPARLSSTVQTAPKRQRLYTYLSSSTDSSDSSSYTSTTDSSEDSSSSYSSDSDSEEEYRSSSRSTRKHTSKKHARSCPKASTKCSSRRQETSVKKQSSRHTSKSKSRKHSKTKKKSSKRTPEKDLPRVPTKQSMKLLGDGNSSCSGRREYLLMKLFQVEKLIAKKKKKMNMK